MPENISRSRGRPEGYKLDRGGVPAESGPFLGVVRATWIQPEAGAYKCTLKLLETQLKMTKPNGQQLAICLLSTVQHPWHLLSLALTLR